MESLAFVIFEMLVPWMQKIKKLKTGSVDSQITAFFCYIPVVSSRQMAPDPQFEETELQS